jgi:glycogen debranching enzyme
VQAERDREAIEILKANDRGGYTVPTSRLYPYQWNWDSAFVALGFATFDQDRAWREIEMLFEGQWDDGMLPHILFRRDDPDYFPGPSVWEAGGAKAGTKMPSSGHSQPPVVATVVRELVETGGDESERRARTFFDKMMAYNRWFHRERDPDGKGVIGVVHPWESGRDNSADWEEALMRVQVPADLGSYQRRDTAHIDAEQRPRQAQYDRYLTLVKFGRESGWKQSTIARQGQFFVADPGVHFMLMRADRDLLALAERLEKTAEADEIRARLATSEAGTDLLWNEAVSAFCARDLKTGDFSDAISSSAALAFYAGAGSAEQRGAMTDHLRRILDKVDYGLPSLDPEHTRFEPKRYWLGPVWMVMNFMIARGLDEAGQTALADRIKADSRRLIEQQGFYEYFNPATGEGCGGDDFSWTAAMWLAWAGQGDAGAKAA